MTKWAVQLKSGDTQGNVDVWVYHKVFNTQTEATELGISFCKDGEEELKELGAAYEYEGTYLFMKDESAFWLINGYEVYPVETQENFHILKGDDVSV